ncbi:MAG: LptF/LptG family permease [Bacteriovorax sp.]|nr:LptF/LptG family permease [Bacteriovorax sp.]
MFTIRKLILKEWLTFFFGAVFILLMVLSLGQILTGLLKATNEIRNILIDLALEIPTFLIRIFPVSCLIASLFSINKLKSRNELTAIFASGFSRRQFVLCIGIIGAIVGTTLFFINGYLVPYTKHQQSEMTNIPSIVRKAKNSSVSINAMKSGRIWFKGQDYFFSYSSFDDKKNIIYDLSLYYYNTSFKFSEEVTADSAKYIEGNSWLLNKGMHVTNLENKTFPEPSPFHEKIFPLKETINDFKKINADISTLNIWRLYDYIAVLRTNGINDSEYFVTFLDKFSSGFTCLVLAILASVALFNPNRRNSSFGSNIAFVLSFTFIYWFVYSYFMTLGQTSKIPAVVATFGVPSLFVIYLSFYFIYHRKLR